ncbi:MULTISPECIES: hypothetical protein [unclassified Moorena]|uniref:hypothetical protein n=1 Tax=unclassified Moorena TaxID=2683338 RepID=UPI0013FFFAD4|nr:MULTISPECIES: hypothetical protein [unclassified Moorena]NEO13729.1 hypothetical protein [Moorena sp. SIO3E8]NEP98394.1 hypothetical protein [Moorena sp. SIO3F7]
MNDFKSEVEWPSWWNWHLGRTGILVELASCQFQYNFARAGCPLYCYSSEDSATLSSHLFEADR